ncbi:MFS general substrate transporter [Thozetella sp. PMI_491]|nr:MFS general substrate transporter [Thozetella sp. PMI_491]
MSAETSAIELQAASLPSSLPVSSAASQRRDSSSVQADETAVEPHDPRHEFSLPPVDGGKDAWLFLAACFMIEGLVWGFPFAFGVFQDYYSSHEPFAGSDNIAVIGTCAMGIMYLSAPLNMALLKLFPRQGRWTPMIGLTIMCLSIGLSSLSNTVPQLIVTQGILFAIGGCTTYSPCIIYLDEWFVRRKGLAYGIMWSGTGLAGVVLPLFLEYLLERFGFRITLQIWSGVLFASTAPLVYFIKPRLPVSAATHRKPVNLRFLLSPTFVLYQLANVVEATGFFLPGIYLPSFARSVLGAGSVPSALTVLLVNVASVFGCVAMGFLSDRFHVTTCILVSTIGATLGTFLLWGFSVNLGVLYLFCVVYGLFAGSFTSAWPGVMKEMAKPRPAADGSDREGMTTGSANSVDPSMVFGFLAAGRGLGNVISGPLSEALVKGSPWLGQGFGGYGSGYGTLIAYTGVTALLGGGSFVWRKLGWL